MESQFLRRRFDTKLSKRMLILLTFVPMPLWSQWQWQNPFPQGNTIQSIQQVDDTTIASCGDDGTIMVSKDAGLTWKVSYFDDGLYNFLRGIFFTDHAHGFAVGTKGRILRTQNGGKDWTKLRI